MQTKQSVIALPSSLLIKILGIVAISLVSANVFLNFLKYVSGDRSLYGLMPLFQLSREQNIPTFFSGCLFLINALLLIIIWRAKLNKSDYHIVWAVLAGSFLFLAYDELFQVHEKLVEPVRETLHTSGLFFFAWVIVYGVGVLLLSVLFFPVWWRLEKTIKLWFALSAIIFISGALGFEMLGGAERETIGGQGSLIYGVLYTIEESLEMIGLIMFTYSLLLLVQKEFNGITLTIGLSSISIPEAELETAIEAAASP